MKRALTRKNRPPMTSTKHVINNAYCSALKAFRSSSDDDVNVVVVTVLNVVDVIVVVSLFNISKNASDN